MTLRDVLEEYATELSHHADNWIALGILPNHNPSISEWLQRRYPVMRVSGLLGGRRVTIDHNPSRQQRRWNERKAKQ